MSDRLIAKVFDFAITTRCTMSCRLCVAGIPYNKNPRHTPKDEAFREIEEFFRVWNFAERIEIIGGEPLMHPDIYEIIEEALKYPDCFGRFRVTTNSTIVPSDRLLELAASCDKPFDFIVDDYGEHSQNLVPLTKKLDEYRIPYRVDVYHGGNQNYGGWIDFGDRTDQGYTDQDLQAVFKKCLAPKYPFTSVNDGKAFSCVFALSLYLSTGRLKVGDYVDLFDDSISLEEKREIARGFHTIPIDACRYCRGFDNENGKRYLGPPEQIYSLNHAQIHEI